jgi:hypothetical protein
MALHATDELASRVGNPATSLFRPHTVDAYGERVRFSPASRSVSTTMHTARRTSTPSRTRRARCPVANPRSAAVSSFAPDPDAHDQPAPVDRTRQRRLASVLVGGNVYQ